MSQIAQKHLLAGFIFGDRETTNTYTCPAVKSARNNPSAYTNTMVPGKIFPWRKQAISSVI